MFNSILIKGVLLMTSCLKIELDGNFLKQSENFKQNKNFWVKSANF